jgi:Subtilase family
MKIRLIRAVAAPGLPVVVICCSLLGATVAAAETVSSLPASDYTVRAVCVAPPPGYAGCLALRLVAKTAAARAHTHPLGMTRSGPVRSSAATEGAYGLRPEDLLSAYDLPRPPQPVSTQTIALVDAYNDSKAESDLARYDQEFGLPACTEADGCFRKVNQVGEEAPLPSSTGKEAQGWAGEISTDIEVAHAVCQNCHILLVEGDSASFPDLEAAEQTAVGLGATEISNSWGGPECSEGPSGPECGEESPAFNHPGIVITAAAGDHGYLGWAAEKPAERGFPDYPASSPHVVAVGGTRLTLGVDGEWAGETVWNDGGADQTGEIEGYGATGGGCSTVFTAQPWQQNVKGWSAVGCGTGAASKRAVADVSADGDPYTGVAVYDSTPFEGSTGWTPVGGTSVASPIIASMYALAGGAYGVRYPAQTLYENLAATPTSLHDVASGSNGACGKPFDGASGLSECELAEEGSSCSAATICLAGEGYDGPSGVGAPDGITAFEPGGEEGRKEVEAQKAKEAREVEERKADERKAEEQRAGEAQAEEQRRKEKTQEEEELIKSEGARGGESTGGGEGGEATSGPPVLAPGEALLAPEASGTTRPGNPNELVPTLSGLSLTLNASLALSRGRPKAFQLAFAFTVNTRVRVRVVLAKRVRASRSTRWQTLPDTLTIAAAAGRDQRRLTGRNPLAHGRYRLTLTPAPGTARSLTFQIA